MASARKNRNPVGPYSRRLRRGAIGDSVSVPTLRDTSPNTSTLGDVALWHERDISHFLIEQVIPCDATVALDFALVRLTKLIDPLAAYPERLRRTLASSGGLVDSTRVLPALTQAGISREDAHAAVQRHAIAAWQSGAGFADRLKAASEITCYLSPAEIDGSFDTAYHLKHIDTIFRRVFGDN